VAAPIAQAAGVVHFGIASDPNVAKGEYNFIHSTKPDSEARLWVEEATRRGYKRVAILCLQQQGELAIAESVKKYAASEGLEIVTQQTFDVGEVDFRTYLMKAGQSEPDIYLALAFSPEVDNLYKQFKEQGIKAEFSGIESLELSSTPALFEGLWYINAADSTDSFREAYKQMFNENPVFGSPNAYDIFNLIVAGYERAGDGVTKPSHAAVAAELAKIQGFQGVLGELNMDPDGIVDSLPVVRMIRNGEPVTLR
jgi:ABC-type branched-subunit amino acid transport system substrate-binding protein